MTANLDKDNNLLISDDILYFQDKQVGPVSLLELIQCCDDNDSSPIYGIFDMAPTFLKWNGKYIRRLSSTSNNAIERPTGFIKGAEFQDTNTFWYDMRDNAVLSFTPPAKADRLLIYVTQRSEIDSGQDRKPLHRLQSKHQLIAECPGISKVIGNVNFNEPNNNTATLQITNRLIMGPLDESKVSNLQSKYALYTIPKNTTEVKFKCRYWVYDTKFNQNVAGDTADQYNLVELPEFVVYAFNSEDTQYPNGITQDLDTTRLLDTSGEDFDLTLTEINSVFSRQVKLMMKEDLDIIKDVYDDFPSDQAELDALKTAILNFRTAGNNYDPEEVYEIYRDTIYFPLRDIVGFAFDWAPNTFGF